MDRLKEQHIDDLYKVLEECEMKPTKDVSYLLRLHIYADGKEVSDEFASIAGTLSVKQNIEEPHPKITTEMTLDEAMFIINHPRNGRKRRKKEPIIIRFYCSEREIRLPTIHWMFFQRNS